MAVEINLDLDASGATGKIGAVAASLKGLERVADDIDIDFDGDIGNITEQIDDFKAALEGLDIDNIDFIDDLDDVTKRLENAMDGEIDMNVGSGNDGGNESDGTIPPDLIQNLTEIGGETRGAATATDGSGEGESEFDIRKFKQRIGEKYGFDPRDIRSLGLRDDADFSDLSWNELQSKAKEEGVYGKNPSRSDLESRLAGKRKFGGRDIMVDTDKLGKVSLDRAMGMQSETDIGATNDNGRNISPGTSGGANSRTLSDYLDADGNNIFKRIDGIGSKREAFEELRDTTRRTKRSFKNAIPSMSQYMQLLAALLPIAVALGTQLLGVAAAMGSVAVAGGAIMGLGLLGHGETMADSMEQAKLQVRDLKREMFEMLQPQMQQFAPIQSRMFDAIPEAFEGEGGIGEQLEGLADFEDTLFELGDALAGGMAEALQIINDNEQAISQLTTRFGGLIGSGLLDFFEWLIQAASENQELLVQVGRDMVKLAAVAYNLSMAVTKIISAMTPFFNLLLWISELLDGAVLIGLIAMIAYIYALAKSAMMVYALGGAFSALSTFILEAQIGMLSYITTTWGAVAATMALVGAIGLLTLGSSLLVGGAVTGAVMSGSPGGGGGSGGGMDGGGGPRRGGGKTVYNDNRQFTVNSQGEDYAAQKGIGDELKKHGETQEAQALPDVEVTSDDSEGDK